MQVGTELRPVLVLGEPAGDLRMGLFQRQGTAAELVIQATVQLLPALHACGLVGNIVARVRRHPHFQFVHGAEKAFNGLGLAVIRPRMDDLAT